MKGQILKDFTVSMQRGGGGGGGGAGEQLLQTKFSSWYCNISEGSQNDLDSLESLSVLLNPCHAE